VSDQFQAVLGSLPGEDWTTLQVDRDAHHTGWTYPRSLRGGRILVQEFPDRSRRRGCTSCPVH
jgi:hypothetical protein